MGKFRSRFGNGKIPRGLASFRLPLPLAKITSLKMTPFGLPAMINAIINDAPKDKRPIEI
jgi:hypothetical protein